VADAVGLGNAEGDIEGDGGADGLAAGMSLTSCDGGRLGLLVLAGVPVGLGLLVRVGVVLGVGVAVASTVYVASARPSRSHSLRFEHSTASTVCTPSASWPAGGRSNVAW
jgi:hypothetical protein